MDFRDNSLGQEHKCYNARFASAEGWKLESNSEMCRRKKPGALNLLIKQVTSWGDTVVFLFPHCANFCVLTSYSLDVDRQL